MNCSARPLPDSQRSRCNAREIRRAQWIDRSTDVATADDLEILVGKVAPPAPSRWNDLVARYAGRHIPVGTNDDLAHRASEDRRCPATCAADNDVHADLWLRRIPVIFKQVQSKSRDVDHGVARRHAVREPAPSFERQFDLLHPVCERNPQRPHRRRPRDAVIRQSVPVLKCSHRRRQSRGVLRTLRRIRGRGVGRQVSQCHEQPAK